MSNISFYDASVATYLQLLPALSGALAVTQQHCQDNNIDPDSLLEERLIDDMWPLSNQLYLARVHSQGALEGVQRGLFEPPPDTLPAISFVELQQHIADAYSYLERLKAEQVNEFAEKVVMFKGGNVEFEFNAVDFILSWSLINFHFHTGAAYSILRKCGVPLGKTNYMGKPRFKIQ